MKKTAPKKKPATIEEQIAALHEAIDALVEKHVDKIAAAAVGVPRGVVEQLALARAEGGSGCRCGVYRHLFKPKD
jgi:ABC-type nitrate/sulfonate/bicarbonate transport system substrate-binding protein